LKKKNVKRERGNGKAVRRKKVRNEKGEMERDLLR